MFFPQFLWVESDIVNQLVIQQQIDQGQLPFGCEFVISLADAKSKIALQNFDAVILNIRLADEDSSAFLAEVNHWCVPVIVLAQVGEEDRVIQWMQQGASDYLIQDSNHYYLKLLPITLNKAIEAAQVKQKLTDVIEQLQTEEQLLQTVIDAVPNKIFIKDWDGQYLLVNQEMASFYGTTVEVLKGKWDADFHLEAAVIQKFVAENRRVIETQQPLFISEEKDVNYLGKERWLQWQKVPVQLPGQSDVMVLGVGTDVTQRRQTELALLHSEQRFRATFEQAAVGICHVSLEGYFLICNQRFCQITGYSYEQLQTLTVQEITYPDDFPHDLKLVQQLLQGEVATYTLEKRYIRQDQTLVWVSLTVSLVRDLSDHPAYFIAVVADITDRKQAEEALHHLNQELESRVEQRTAELQQSNRQLQEVMAEQQKLVALVENSLDCIAIATPEARMTYLNRAGRQRVGLDETTDITTYVISDFHFPEDWPELQANVLEALLRGENWQGEVRLRHFQTQTAIPMMHSAFPIKHSQTGELLAVAGVLRDVSQQKQIEADLRASKRRYATLATAAPVAILRFDHLLNCVYVNDRWSEMSGRPKASALNKGWIEALHPDDRAEQAARWTNIPADSTPGNLMINEGRHLRPDGNINWFYMQMVPELDIEGNIVGYIGTLTDITERKQIENALYESQQFLQTVLDTFPQSVFWKDRNFRYLGCNQNFLQDAGLASVADLIGKRDDDLPWRNQAAAYWADDQQVMDLDEAKLGIIEPLTQANGDLIWLETNKLPLHNHRGEVIGVLGTYQDITVRKQAEQQLQDVSERLNLALQSAPIGIWEWDIVQNTKIWDTQMCKLYGIDITQVDDFYQAWIDSIHPIDRNNTDLAIQQALQGEKDYNTEFRVIRPDGTVQHIKAYGTVQRNEQGQPLRMIGINIDISDRKQAEQQLYNVSERLNLALQAAQIGVWELDIGTEHLIWDDRMFDLYGINPEDFRGHYSDWEQRVHPDDLESQHQIEQQALNGEHNGEGEFRVVHPDGTIRYILARAHIQRNEKGEPQRVFGVNMDITNYKYAEAAIRESEQRYATLTEIAPVAIFRFDLSRRCVYVNDRWSEMTGRPTSAGLGLEWIEAMYPVDREWMPAEILRWLKICKAGDCYRGEARILRPDGSILWFSCHIVPEIDNNGTITGYIGTLTDINTLKQAEAALRQNEERLRLAMEGAQMATWDVDLITGKAIWSDRHFTMLGYEPNQAGEASEALWFDRIHPDDQERVAQEWQQSRQEKRFYRIEYRIIRADNGQIAWLIGIGSFTYDLNNEPVRSIGILFDITNRKLIELALQASEERWQLALQGSNDGIWDWNVIDGTVFFSDRWKAIRGFAVDEITNTVEEWSSRIHPDDYDRVMVEVAKHFAGNTEFYQAEYRVRCKDGCYKWILDRGKALRDETGQAVRMAGSETDITRRKLAETALQESEQRYRALMEGASDAILVVDLEGHLLTGNRKAEQLLGYTREEISHLTIAQIHPLKEQARHAIEFHKIIQNGTGQVLDATVLCKDGNTIPVDITANIVEAGGKCIVLAIFRDITAQKQAEERLRESKASLLEAQRVAHIGSWIFDLQTQTVAWSEELYRMFGLDPSQAVPSDEAFLQKIHPEDRAALAQCTETVIKEGTPYKIDYRVLLPDGSIRYHEGRGEVIRDGQGKVVKLYGTALDITDRKQVELELRQNRDLREAFFEQSTDALFIVNPETELILDCNQRAVELFEASDKSELINICGNTLQRHPFAPTQLAAIIAEVTSKGFWNQEIEYVTRKGRYFWANAAGTKIFVAGKDARIMRLSDITDRKEIEQVLQQQLCKEQLLVSVLMRIRDSLDLSTILDATVQEVQQVLKTDRILVYQLNPDQSGQVVTEACTAPWTPLLNLTFSAEPFSQAGFQRYLDGEYYLIEDCYEAGMAECALQFMQDFQIRAKLVIPIMHQEEKSLWGLLIAHQCSQARQWEFWEIGLLQQLAEQLAIAIQQADLYHQVQTELMERQRAEAALQRTNEQLQRVNRELARATRLKDEFLANMSHELRTPLNAVLGMSEVLQEEIFGALNDQQQKAVRTIEQSGRHLLELITDILDLAKIEAGKLELQMAPCSIQHLCTSSLNLIKQMAYKKNIQLNTTIAPDLDEIEMDDRRMLQVLVNLLSNAVKFTPDGGSISLEVWSQSATASHSTALHSTALHSTASHSTALQPPETLQCSRSSPQQFVYISVQDTGIGIALEHMPKLFQSFVQIDSNLNRQYSGTGLGLALVKRIVEMHGGWVEVESQPGQGSQFTIVLPYQPCQTRLRGNSLPTSSESSNLPSPVQTNSTPNQQPLILLVEDNQANIETYSNYLIHSGYRLVVANNGLEAVSQAQLHQPDLILMDIQIPEVDGLEAARQIRALPELIDVPIIALTALAMPGDRERCIEVGMNEYLAKPIRLRQLANQISQLLHP